MPPSTMSSVAVWPQLSDTPLDFAYIPSSMSQGPALGLGLALAQPGRGVVVVNGDGCTLMSLGSLVTLANHPALLYLLNPTAGLLDGDGQLVRLTARARARAVVVGQSATRIHPCPNGFATQQWAISVEAGAALVVLPGPAIPFAGCRYYQRVEVELEDGAGFVWGDVGLAGRYARGAASEQFQFAVLVQDLSVRRDGRLVFRDRFCWQGPWEQDTARWHFGGAPACGVRSRAARTAWTRSCSRYGLPMKPWTLARSAWSSWASE